MRKIIFSDNNYEDIARSLVIGVVIGSLIGVILDKIILFFATGGIVGLLVTVSTIVSVYYKSK